MNKETKETIKVRGISIGFSLLALAVFKPFGLGAWQWEAYAHLLGLGMLGLAGCTLTEMCLKYLIGMPRSAQLGVDYIIRRNLWFQFINTPLISLMICLYRHLVLSARVDNNELSWTNFFETLVIMAFCSFAIGLYWRFKFRNRFLALELEETRVLNEQLRMMQKAEEDRPLTENDSRPARDDEVVTLTGTTSESVTLRVRLLLYVEAVGNYVRVTHLHEGQAQTDMIRTTLKQVEQDLHNHPTIVRCHRAFLVNLQQVEQIVSSAGSMHLLISHCHASVPVSRSNIAQIKKTILVIKGYYQPTPQLES